MSFLCKSTAWIKRERRPSVCVGMKRMSKVASIVRKRKKQKIAVTEYSKGS